MVTIVYLYSKCSTCQKALQFLKARNIPCEIREITATPPSLEELRCMLQYMDGNVKKLLNTSGNMYRELKLNTKLSDMTVDEILTLLTRHGMLIKRPFLLGPNFGLVGFREPQWIQAFSI